MDQNQTKPPGLPPGTLVYVGDRMDHEISIRVIDYTPHDLSESNFRDINDTLTFKTSNTVSWVNIDGVHDIELIRSIGAVFDLHPLLLEDIVNTVHRPKVEDQEEHLFFTFKMLNFNEKDLSLGSEQVSIILGSSYVLSFQETPHDVFDPVRNRIKANKGRIRRKNSDYLVYALIDAVVDSYFTFIESYDKSISELEDRIHENPQQEDFNLIQRLKKQLLRLRRTITPLHEAISFMLNTESELIEPRTVKYYRDVYDHLHQVLDSIELNRGLLEGLVDTYMSSMSNRMNQVMKVLTIIATIFIPLTFIAGIYGMNFTHMPELGWKYSYPTLLGSMAFIFVGMLIYFKKSKWL
ncbi:MAG: magnesium/cobalt transporter CorA [FCB group bacterium]|nr:magnesium/cobalt transporter CorA [FCB group bacterium]MBL7029448.1 magnesium/cobalt transporter CorA [Candidatus Neomarinimicrobiota bacterium]